MASLATPPYIELHAHSGYSFLDGASHPEDLVLQASTLGYSAMALTDHDGLYGSMAFATAARASAVFPITGVELTVRECGLPEAPAPHRMGLSATIRPDEPPGHFHLTLLATSPQGYANLCRIVTAAHVPPPGTTRTSHPAVSLAGLLSHAEGLIVLTGCRRSPLWHALSDAVATGEAFAKTLRDAVGPENLFVELQDNRVQGDGPRNRALAKLADRMGIPVVATGNVHYHRRELAHLQDVLVAIRHRTTLDGSHVLRRPNSCFHLRAPEEMAADFATRPDALRNTLVIAERCMGFDLMDDLGYSFPDFEGNHRGSAMEILSEVTWRALEERYPIRDGQQRRADAKARLEEELRLVARHGLGGFFLVYRDIMELARQVASRVRGDAPRGRAHLPPGRGRGSSVSSIICYLIGLSHVDPVEANLFLGRFLNEAMGSVPDIDLDFPRDIREALILEVYRKYGYDHTGLVAIFPSFRLRSAIREVGRVMELPAGDLETLARMADHRTTYRLEEDIARIPALRDRIHTRPWSLFLKRVEEILGLPRHISQHVGGMIISSRPLLEIVPLEPAAMQGRVLCQWDKDACDDARFIKIDFLALGMLSLVEEAVDLIAERQREAPDLSRINLDDPAIYDAICDGDTVGTFQIESRAQIQMIRRTRPRNLKELAIQVAIVRPGPIVGGAVNPYVRRREALRNDPATSIPLDHPLLHDALAETLGVILYQDQVLQVCRDLAGFTDGQAESLRRAMSRRRSGDAMRAHWKAFRDGAQQRGVSHETAAEVFRQVVGFSAFGFPKSHAAAFGLLAYQSAWLRHYFPVEYTVALFNNQPMGFYSLDVLGRDARRRGVPILPPDVNASHVRCTVEAGSLRVGLGLVRGWGEAIAQRVVAVREAHEPYRGLTDFLRRTPAALRRPAVENLIWAGGLDGFGLERRELLWQAGLWLGPDKERTRARGRADDPQMTLALSTPSTTPDLPTLDARDRLVADYRMLRFSTGDHPLALVRAALPPDVSRSCDLAHLPQGAGIAVAGVVVARQRPGTAKGYLFVLIEDEYSHINVIVKPGLYESRQAILRMEPFLLVRGRLQRDGATLNVIATWVEGLRMAREAAPPLPETLEYWAKPRGAEDPLAWLADLRPHTPESRDWGRS
jgi:error-prone DNA polymerase